METTLHDLSRSVEKLERKFDILQFDRGKLRDVPLEPERPLTPAERGAMLKESARRNAAYENGLWHKIFDEMGITAEPVSREEARRLYLEAGFDPEANDFAQGIIAMREE